MLKYLPHVLLCTMAACQLPAEKKARQMQAIDSMERLESVDTNQAISADMPPLSLPEPPRQQEPAGAYQTVLPGGVEHIIYFLGNHQFQLQERFSRDSLVIITGTWSPSNGMIWAYKDQVVRARYRWKGKQLEYYNPVLKKGFLMNPMTDIAANAVWQKKKQAGAKFFGIGNEPFWSLEISRNDSASFRLADWSSSLPIKLSPVMSGDTLMYRSGDSIRVTILPQFCSDGMSDNIYRQAVQVQYHKELYRGCGMRF